GRRPARVHGRSSGHLSRLAGARPRREQTLRGPAVGTGTRYHGDLPSVETGGGGVAHEPQLMAPRIRHIATRFALLLGGAAVLPLLAYGFVSILSLQRGTRASVVNGNQNVAVRAAEEIRRYVVANADLLKALSADLQNTGLEQWQQDRILKNYVLQFREFRE